MTNICGLLGLKVQPWDPWPENWIAQEKDTLAGPDEVRVEGAIDREAGTQTAWQAGFLEVGYIPSQSHFKREAIIYPARGLNPLELGIPFRQSHINIVPLVSGQLQPRNHEDGTLRNSCWGEYRPALRASPWRSRSSAGCSSTTWRFLTCTW